ncbi:MAG: ornithine carbamoyltransferase [Gammaproteobacteria bacterium]|nr:ornithine carbamoyltransferase [Gammaproteobacteria bacterium]
MATQHFLTLNDLDQPTHFQVLSRAAALKNVHQQRRPVLSLPQRVLAMIFEKSSTRTRVSFEAGIHQLGGTAIFLSPADTQLGRGEPLSDTARVLSEMVDAVMIRTDRHDKLETFAQYSNIPVINGLSDSCHPCQLLADLQTMLEKFGQLADLKVAWIGDGNNVCQTYCEAAGLFGFDLVIAGPSAYQPDPHWVALGQGRVQFSTDPVAAVQGAQVVTTDVWASMGQEAEIRERRAALAPFQVTESLLEKASDEVMFLHCLPAHRGEEISATLLDDPRTKWVWTQAGNRLHAQKALMEYLILGQISEIGCNL